MLWAVAFYALFVPLVWWAIPRIAERIDTRHDWRPTRVRAPAILEVEVPALDDLEGMY